MAKFLWNFNVNPTLESAFPDVPGTIASINLPTLVPPTTDPSSNKGAYIDVVKDYYWTYSQARQEVPHIILTEKRLKVNSLLSQLIYSFGAAGEITEALATQLNAAVSNPDESALVKFILGGATSAINTINNGVQAIGTAAGAVGSGFSNLNQRIGNVNFNNVVSGQVNAAKQGASTIGNSLQAVIANVAGAATDENAKVDKSNYLKPYRNLYITKDTGWVYNLPYFQDDPTKFDNNFSQSGNGIEQELASFLGGIANKAVELLALPTASLGERGQFAFQERAKFYNFPTDGESIDVEFPLINTGSVTYEDVVRNWQLLYLLVYQNKPARVSKTIVEPPVLYQVEIPGAKFLPFCYITNIDIRYVGSRRQMNITIPMIDVQTNNNPGTVITNLPPTTADVGSKSSKNQTFTIPAIIPDAYKVKITLKSLTSETRNFLCQAITDPPVTTGFVGTN